MLSRLSVVLSFLILLFTPAAFAQADLKVSDNGRYLVYTNGKPFFYLGDTAWELIHRLNREETIQYLTNRAEKGFTVIQAVALAEHNGLHDPNAFGQTPLVDDDPAQPNEAYFQHVDFVLNKAKELGLHIALLPTWGDKLNKDKWGEGPEVFNTEKAYVYGKYLGNRYKAQPNIIWVIGGDRNPRANFTDVEVWRALAKGITEGVGGKDKALMTFHPQTASSNWFHQDDWLDFNMLQTGHCPDVKVWEKISHDYNLNPTKPTFDGEPLYEEIPICFDVKNGYADVNDVRRKAYLSLFAGAHGHTYGCNNIWQMYAPGRKRAVDATKPWYESLDLPGAKAMTHVRKLMESRPMLERVPDQTLIASENSEDLKKRVQATRGTDYAFVYSAGGLPFKMNMGKISGKKVKVYWYNPRTGTAHKAGKQKNTDTHLFTPLSQGNDQDWVLILDNAQSKYPALSN